MAGTYTYDQIHQLTVQAGYQGAQADAIAKQLYTSQQTGSKTPTSGGPGSSNPDFAAASSQLAARGSKFLLGAVLGIVGLVALFRPDIEGLITKTQPALQAASTVENIRTQRKTRKLREVQTARETHELEQARATSRLPNGQLASRSGSGGTLGEQPGNEPTSGDRPVKPTKVPEVKEAPDPEAQAWREVQAAQRALQRENTRPAERRAAAARGAWEAIATPEQVERRQGQTVRRNNKESAGQREAPDIPVSEQRRQGHLRRAPLPGGTRGTIGAQPARRKKKVDSREERAGKKYRRDVERSAGQPLGTVEDALRRFREGKK